MTMTPSRPYLLRALYQWIVDNNMVPNIVVNATFPGVDVPKEHVKNGKIVLDIRPAAIRDLEISNEFIQFRARFLVVRTVYVPMEAITTIYAVETGQGMVFPEEDFGSTTVGQLEPEVSKKADVKKPAKLKLVK